MDPLHPDSLVDQYFHEIEDSSGLPSDIEKELSKKIQEGDEAAFQKLVQANLRFVVTVAKKFQHQGLPLSDLISIGNLGLAIAAKRFDGSKGLRFITYAVWWIRQAILQTLKERQSVHI